MEQELQQSRDLLDSYNKLDEKTQDKLINGVKCLALLQDLANTEKDNDKPAAQMLT